MMQQPALYKTKVYPNPAANSIQVTISSKMKNNNLSIVLADNYGNRIAIRNINAGVSTTSFDVSKLASGTYWIKINDGNTSTIEKVIVQH